MLARWQLRVQCIVLGVLVVEIGTNREKPPFVYFIRAAAEQKGLGVGVWGRLGGHGMDFTGRRCCLRRKEQ